jgi:hypothetical protein
LSDRESVHVRLPSDGDGETPALLRLVAALADPAQRATSARALAAAMGADDLLVTRTPVRW